MFICFSSLEFKVKKGGWGPFTSGGSRQIQFQIGQGDEAVLKPSGKVLQVSIGQGLPRNSRELWPESLIFIALSGLFSTFSLPVWSAGPTRKDKRKSRYMSNQAPPSSHYSSGDDDDDDEYMVNFSSSLRYPVVQVFAPEEDLPEAAPPPPGCLCWDSSPAWSSPLCPATRARGVRRTRLQATLTWDSWESLNKALQGEHEGSHLGSLGYWGSLMGLSSWMVKYRVPDFPLFILITLETRKSQYPGRKRESVVIPASTYRLQRRRSKEVTPLPGAGRPKPAPKPKPRSPQCRALYAYDAQDTDELSFNADDVIEIISEGTSPSTTAVVLLLLYHQ